MRRASVIRASVALLGGAALLAACGGSESKPQAPTKSGRATSKVQLGDDASRCDFQGRSDREVIESAGPGAIQPNIRRVYAIVGEGEERRKQLLCREVDSNLDGVKDVVRTYSDKGESLHEQADTDYNGQIDTWITFASGRIGKVQLDSSGDGRPDETRFYVGGKLRRIERDTNGDGKADVWESYEKGRLSRMGVDVNHDGQVDRWDRDQDVVRAEEEKEKAEEKAADAGAVSDAGVTDAYVSPRNR